MTQCSGSRIIAGMPQPPNAIVHWLSIQSETSAFARSLLRYMATHQGDLTDRQLERAQHMIDREARRHRRLLRPGREEIIAMTRRWPPSDRVG